MSPFLAHLPLPLHSKILGLNTTTKNWQWMILLLVFFLAPVTPQCPGPLAGGVFFGNPCTNKLAGCGPVSCSANYTYTCNAGRYSLNADMGTCTSTAPCDTCNATTSACKVLGTSTVTYSWKPNSASCAVCAPGKYSNAGATSCTDCAGGTFSADSGSASCTICPAGQSCDPGASSTQNCSAGGYCPRGSSSPLACSAGTYNPLTGSSTIDACLKCPPATFNPFSGGTSNASCVLCPSSFYCPKAGAATGTQFFCPAGFFCMEGSVNPTPCPPGYYCPQGSGSPTPCAPGYWGPGNSTSALCSGLCAAGRFSSSAGNASGCEGPCQAGTYGPSYTVRGNSFCTPCTQGGFCPENSIAPVLCPPGRAGLAILGASLSDCTVAPAGSYTDTPGATAFSVCPAGTFSSASGGNTSLGCRACGGGQYASEPGGATVCLVCPPGYFTDSPASPFYDSSAPGYDRVSLLKSPKFPVSCKRCPMGTTGDSNSTGLCQACPPGSFNPLLGRPDPSFCLPCPIGTFASTPGASFCPPCPFGSYSSQPGSSTCTPDDTPTCPSPLVPVAASGTQRSYCAGCPAGYAGSCSLGSWDASHPFTFRGPVLNQVLPNRTCLVGGGSGGGCTLCSGDSATDRCPGLTLAPLPPLPPSTTCGGLAPMAPPPLPLPFGSPTLGALAYAVGEGLPTAFAQDALAASTLFFILFHVALTFVYCVARQHPRFDAAIGNTSTCRFLLSLYFAFKACACCNRCRRVGGSGGGEGGRSTSNLLSSRALRQRSDGGGGMEGPDPNAFLPLDSFFKTMDGFSMETHVKPGLPVINRPTPWGGYLRITGILLFAALSTNFLLSRALDNINTVSTLLLLTQDAINMVPGAPPGMVAMGSASSSSSSSSTAGPSAWNTLSWGAVAAVGDPAVWGGGGGGGASISAGDSASSSSSGGGAPPPPTLIVTLLAQDDKGRCASALSTSPSSPSAIPGGVKLTVDPATMRWGSWVHTPSHLPCSEGSPNPLFLHTFSCAGCMLGAATPLVIDLDPSCQSLVVGVQGVDGLGSVSTLTLDSKYTQGGGGDGKGGGGRRGPISAVNWTVSAVLSKLSDNRVPIVPGGSEVWGPTVVSPVDPVRRYGYVLLPGDVVTSVERDGSDWEVGRGSLGGGGGRITLTVTFALESYFYLVTLTDRISLVAAITSICALLGIMSAVKVANPEKCLKRVSVFLCSSFREPPKPPSSIDLSAGGGSASRVVSRRGTPFTDGGNGGDGGDGDDGGDGRNGVDPDWTRGGSSSNINPMYNPTPTAPPAPPAPPTSDTTLEELAPPPLPSGWEECVDETDGMTYFYHAPSQHSQWHRPTEEEKGGEGGEAGDAHHHHHYNSSSDDWKRGGESEELVEPFLSPFHEQQPGSTSYSPSPPLPTIHEEEAAHEEEESGHVPPGHTSTQALPPGWVVRQSTHTGGVYYKNKERNVSQWTVPLY